MIYTPLLIHYNSEITRGNFYGTEKSKSRNLFFNPESMLRSTSVKVYTDRLNYKKYYVDIDEVLSKIEYH